MARHLVAVLMAVSFVPAVFLVALAAAGCFSRFWWRALLEVLRVRKP
ncbi:MAG: hypothetical protein ACM32J_17250 [Rhizobacter sp.]